ncbi:hypothetical protein R6Q57_018594 [Mikania cordata]
MDFNSISHEEEEERESLINGAGVATVKVVEYMLSSMSNELLTKFPDNSAFDFDYNQSSIWSPLVPHPSNPPSPVPKLQRKLSYDDEEDAIVEDMMSGSCVFNCFRVYRKFIKRKMIGMKRRRSSFRGFNRLGPMCSNSANVVAGPVSSSPIRIKGLKKLLKATSKQFKKTLKKKDSGSHLKLSSQIYL